MNIKRGLFRLWIVASVFWIAFIVFMNWSSIVKDRWISGDPWWKNDPLAELPVRCDEARGTKGVDYTTRDAAEPWNKYRTITGACWYNTDNFQRLWPEYNGLDHKVVEKRLYDRLGWDQTLDTSPFYYTKQTIIAALVPPLAIIIGGSALVWALSGFSRPKPSP